MTQNKIPLRFEARVYTIAPDMRLVCEIEQELGGIRALTEKFSSNLWRVSDLVALIHMMLHSAGRTVDFRLLGDRMLEDGLEQYLAVADKFLKRIVPC